MNLLNNKEVFLGKLTNDLFQVPQINTSNLVVVLKIISTDRLKVTVISIASSPRQVLLTEIHVQ